MSARRLQSGVRDWRPEHWRTSAAHGWRFFVPVPWRAVRGGSNARLSSAGTPTVHRPPPAGVVAASISQEESIMARCATPHMGEHHTADAGSPTVGDLAAYARQLEAVLGLLLDATSDRECDPRAPALLQLSGQYAAELGDSLGRLDFLNEKQLIDASPRGTTSLDARLHQAVAQVSLAAGQHWQFNDWQSITRLGWVLCAARDLLCGVLEALQPDPVQGIAA